MNLIFCEVLRQIRKERFFTQEDLAEAAGINEKYYGKIERGESSPTLTVFFLLCSALDISPKKFMELMEKKE